MQTLIQVFCAGKGSLRETIAKDAKIEDYDLTVSEIKKGTRPSGWSKIHSTVGSHGAINIEWDSNTNMLWCRVITKKGSNPSEIIAAFMNYLLSKHKRRIEFINILPR
jgi:hypothetical protein